MAVALGLDERGIGTEVVFIDTVPTLLGSRSEEGLLVLTDSSCMIRVATDGGGEIHEVPWPGIPTLIWPEGVDLDVSDWMRELVVKFGVAPSSAYEYAKTVRPFFRYCRTHSRRWQTVDDRFLIGWRKHLVDQQIGVNRINTGLDRVFAFYKWAEETHRLKMHVGVYFLDEIPPEFRDVEFAISARRKLNKTNSGKVVSEWATPLRLAGETQPFRHTPTEEEIKRLHGVAGRSRNAERNSLMWSWAEEVGARRAEFASIRCDQMPSHSQLAEFIEHDRPFTLTLRRKGARSLKVLVPIELIVRTLDYIEFERQEIVARFSANRKGYLDRGLVFLSSTTGQSLHLDSITSMARRHFKGARIENASLHRLRARFAVNVISALLDAWFDREHHLIGNESSWVETILTKASVMMGHISPRSLRPYLTTVLNQRIQTADSSKNFELSAKLRQLELMVRAAARRLKGMTDLHLASRMIQEGDNFAAAELLESMAKNLRSQQ